MDMLGLAPWGPDLARGVRGKSGPLGHDEGRVRPLGAGLGYMVCGGKSSPLGHDRGWVCPLGTELGYMLAMDSSVVPFLILRSRGAKFGITPDNSANCAISAKNSYILQGTQECKLLGIAIQ